MRKLKMAGIPVACSALLALFCGCRDAPMAQVAGGKIAFRRGMPEPGGNADIFVMNADGTGQVNLTQSPQFDASPVWSPDGTRIAFSSKQDDGFDIYAVGADGSAQTNLTRTSADDTGAVWSPDGSRIAFVAQRDGNLEIYVMNADGSGQTNLSRDPARDSSPHWSPDGTRIAFTSGRDGEPEVYVMNADGSEQTNLTQNPAGDGSPRWSPEGDRILFVSDRDGDLDIFVMEVDGSGQTNLTHDTARTGAAAWSPDGSRIVYNRWESNETAGVYVMAADGSEQTALTDPNERGVVNAKPSWSPDGSRIVFLCDRNLFHRVYVVNADGTGETQLTPDAVFHGEPAWAPAPAGQTGAEPAAPEIAAQPPADTGADQQRAAALVKAALAAKNEGRLDDAETKLREAIGLDTRNVDAHWVLAWTLVALKRHPEAIEEFRAVVALAPDGKMRSDAQTAIGRLE